MLFRFSSLPGAQTAHDHRQPEISRRLWMFRDLLIPSFHFKQKTTLRNSYGETMSDTAGASSFETFFLNQWLLLQRRYVDQLISASASASSSSSSLENDEQKRLVDDVLSHYKRYFNEKSAAARDDVFVFFSPPWLGWYEKVLLWVGGFKPSLAFRLVNGSVNDLTVEQAERMERVEAETRAEEREVALWMETLQESVADPPLGKLARQYGKLVDGEESAMEEGFEILTTGMTAVLEAADELRCYTVGKVVEILRPAQAVRFLAAAGKLQLKLRDLTRSLIPWNFRVRSAKQTTWYNNNED